jgi:hypothetical protein
MAFTASEERQIFECLGYTYTTTVYRIQQHAFGVGLGEIVQTTARDAYNAVVALLTADDETRVRAHLTEYATIIYDTGDIKAGGVEGASGLEYSPERARNRIRRLIQYYIPLYRIGEDPIDENPAGVQDGILMRG